MNKFTKDGKISKDYLKMRNYERHGVKGTALKEAMSGKKNVFAKASFPKGKAMGNNPPEHIKREHQKRFGRAYND